MGCSLAVLNWVAFFFWNWTSRFTCFLSMDCNACGSGLVWGWWLTKWVVCWVGKAQSPNSIGYWHLTPLNHQANAVVTATISHFSISLVEDINKGLIGLSKVGSYFGVGSLEICKRWFVSSNDFLMMVFAYFWSGQISDFGRVLVV